MSVNEKEFNIQILEARQNLQQLVADYYPSEIVEYNEDTKEANQDICSLINIAYAALAEAEKIANKTGAWFDFETTYGGGASYNGAEQCWSASSQSC